MSTDVNTAPTDGATETERADLLFITWQRHGGRAREIADALGGQALQVHPRLPGGRRLPNVVRYALSSMSTAWALARLRPGAVMVVNPPVVPGLIVAAYSALTGRPFVLDSHTGSFGVKENPVTRAMLPVTRVLARRASAVAVAAQPWADQVRAWGGRAVIVHEAPPARTMLPPEPDGKAVALFVGVFAGDEPVAEVVEAARALPGVRFRITGDVDRCPAELLRSAPANVEFVGFLDTGEYWRNVREAAVLLALTTEPTSVMRAAYEAVYAGRALVVSDWPVLRETFPLAHHTANRADALAAAVREALAATDPQAVAAAFDLQRARWAEQRQELLVALARR
ncbi:glycosyltransferase [Kineococcus radiotolerans]|uniref:Glycosyl transferase group 1 n=1 Tax=Kineococcus radiotolerans (strain ATCC BAA-149 / DSM 14245 / SRS30216) TaxID=266940 RepID=A6WE98_KINRD|nr:glycosyltransferase [Kineococcus radiotolerans]ABS05137.1 hypothetical protein Krad_3674 [Kineococcus radiotolerans SRS30216 = ATCC BAA-149]